LSTATRASYDTQAEIAAAFGVGAEFAAFVNGDRNTLLISATDDASTQVWMIIEGNDTDIADTNDSVILVATLTGVTVANAAAMVAGNFQA
jgi:hypothetical protein